MIYLFDEAVAAAQNDGFNFNDLCFNMNIARKYKLDTTAFVFLESLDWSYGGKEYNIDPIIHYRSMASADSTKFAGRLNDSVYYPPVMAEKDGSRQEIILVPDRSTYVVVTGSDKGAILRMYQWN